jgi:DNA-directed RNA polymerase sigma subunit (sigma70/sigma32)
VISVLNKAIEELWKKLEREPSTYEIAKRMRISIYDIESLSRSVGEDGGNITLEDTIQDESDGPGWLTLWQQ